MEIMWIEVGLLVTYVLTAYFANRFWTAGSYSPSDDSIQAKRWWIVSKETTLLHEQRHQQQNKMGWLNFETSLAYMSWVLIIMLNATFFRINLLYWLVAIPAGFMILLEIDAWIYAARNKGVCKNELLI
jgi:hypothetical protein